jgi:hypothetical protein
MLLMVAVVPVLSFFTILHGIFQKDGQFWEFTLCPLKTGFRKLYRAAVLKKPPRLRWILALGFIFWIVFLIV